MARPLQKGSRRSPGHQHQPHLHGTVAKPGFGIRKLNERNDQRGQNAIPVSDRKRQRRNGQYRQQQPHPPHAVATPAPLRPVVVHLGAQAAALHRPLPGNDDQRHRRHRRGIDPAFGVQQHRQHTGRHERYQRRARQRQAPRGKRESQREVSRQRPRRPAHDTDARHGPGTHQQHQLQPGDIPHAFRRDPHADGQGRHLGEDHLALARPFGHTDHQHDHRHRRQVAPAPGPVGKQSPARTGMFLFFQFVFPITILLLSVRDSFYILCTGPPMRRSRRTAVIHLFRQMQSAR